MGREKSLEALLFLHDKEETKREKGGCYLAYRGWAFVCLCAVLYFERTVVSSDTSGLLHNG